MFIIILTITVLIASIIMITMLVSKTRTLTIAITSFLLLNKLEKVYNLQKVGLDNIYGSRQSSE